MKLSETYKTVLNEKYVNFFRDNLRTVIDPIWDMFTKAYSHLDGGFATASNKQELIEKTWLAKCVRHEQRLLACKLYRDQHGRKSIGAASDGTLEGKKALFSIIEEDVLMKRSWAEVSDVMEHIMAKKGAIPVPNIYAEFLTGKKIHSLDPDGYHYTRELGGKERRKIIFAYEGFSKEVENLMKQK